MPIEFHIFHRIEEVKCCKFQFYFQNYKEKKSLWTAVRLSSQFPNFIETQNPHKLKIRLPANGLEYKFIHFVRIQGHLVNSMTDYVGCYSQYSEKKKVLDKQLPIFSKAFPF